MKYERATRLCRVALSHFGGLWGDFVPPQKNRKVDENTRAPKTHKKASLLKAPSLTTS